MRRPQANSKPRPCDSKSANQSRTQVGRWLFLGLMDLRVYIGPSPREREGERIEMID